MEAILLNPAAPRPRHLGIGPIAGTWPSTKPSDRTIPRQLVHLCHNCGTLRRPYGPTSDQPCSNRTRGLQPSRRHMLPAPDASSCAVKATTTRRTPTIRRKGTVLLTSHGPTPLPRQPSRTPRLVSCAQQASAGRVPPNDRSGVQSRNPTSVPANSARNRWPGSSVAACTSSPRIGGWARPCSGRPPPYSTSSQPRTGLNPARLSAAETWGQLSGTPLTTGTGSDVSQAYRRLKPH